MCVGLKLLLILLLFGCAIYFTTTFCVYCHFEDMLDMVRSSICGISTNALPFQLHTLRGQRANRTNTNARRIACRTIPLLRKHQPPHSFRMLLSKTIGNIRRSVLLSSCRCASYSITALLFPCLLRHTTWHQSTSTT